MIVDTSEKDLTKSISWLSLSKETQEKIVNACLKRSTYKVLNDEYEGMDKSDVNFCMVIHEALGCTEAHTAKLIFNLEWLVIRGQGGVFEPIKIYVTKYREIESAAIDISNQRKTAKENPTLKQLAKE